MDEMMLEIAQYKQEGFYCSQILLLLGLDALGKENPDLVRTMQGAAMGLGGAGELCGALIGGACLLALYAGKGTPGDMEDPRLNTMVQSLVAWFKETYGEPYSGIRCAEILAGDPQNKSRCGEMVLGTYQKVKELLIENGFDLYGTDL